MFKCKHEDCTNNKHEGLGYCRKHYEQFKKHGKTFTYTRCTFNEIVDCGDHYELILTNKDMKEVGRAKIDKEDLAKIKVVGRWSLNEGYAFNSITGMLMHRIIMNAKDSEEVDHKNTEIKSRLDNRKNNLRLATRQENSFNKGKRVDNKSGFKGVTYNKPTDSWRAQATIKGKSTYLGLFASPEEASYAYKLAVSAVHKEFLHDTQKVFKRKTLIRFSRKLNLNQERRAA